MLWSLITLAAYLAALWLYRRSGHHLLCLPVLTGTGLVLAALALAGTGYPVYAEATRVLRWLSGPAVIALAVPLYRQAALLAALAAGCLVSVLGTVALCWLLDTPMSFALSLAPKAATMPMALLAAERAGGVPAVAPMAVVATSVLGPLLAGPLLRWLWVAEGTEGGADGEVVRSFTLGLVAHAIGVARVLQTHPGSVAFAALAMGLNGVATSLVLVLLSRWV
jgi:putative effector of murein hydrolase